MTIRKSLALLAKLMDSSAASGRRLPAGRCACHESTVKWCTRHGEPMLRGPSVVSGAGSAP